ncbi:MAG: DUF438 domain-containing protein [Spirochaetaceae bacterium]|nr:DUF438 domain-containing protein [Spirochaetaceae bacterium]
MSEVLTTDLEKQAKLKAIIKRLHAGATAAEVKRDFANLIKGVSAPEVAAMEQSLVDEGFPVEEIQRLCEVHVAVFESSLEKGEKPAKMPGHPVHSFMAENRELERLLRRLLKASLGWLLGARTSAMAGTVLEELHGVTIHYARKENQLFPYLERQGFTGPSKVMWGKHDELRALLAACDKSYREASGRAGARSFFAETRKFAAAARRMIFMEERILYPNALKRLSERDWAEIRKGEAAIGFAWIVPGAAYDADLVLARLRDRAPRQGLPASTVPAGVPAGAEAAASSTVPPGVPPAGNPPTQAAEIELNTGALSPELLDLALKALPLDFSIVDEEDRVRYYSDVPERIFPRSPAVIGRAVQNCHPPKSVATVERILASFKRKERDSARFWIEMGGRFIVIEYKALYDAEGRYRGTLETTMDAKQYRELKGERRLLDWD